MAVADAVTQVGAVGPKQQQRRQTSWASSLRDCKRAVLCDWAGSGE